MPECVLRLVWKASWSRFWALAWVHRTDWWASGNRIPTRTLCLLPTCAGAPAQANLPDVGFRGLFERSSDRRMTHTHPSRCLNPTGENAGDTPSRNGDAVVDILDADGRRLWNSGCQRVVPSAKGITAIRAAAKIPAAHDHILRAVRRSHFATEYYGVKLRMQTDHAKGIRSMMSAATQNQNKASIVPVTIRLPSRVYQEHARGESAKSVCVRVA